jgi:hypothetical protein
MSQLDEKQCMTHKENITRYREIQGGGWEYLFQYK